ncbi:MAG: hypothetical protein AB7V26_12935 [Lysobacterales bacterium]
MARHKFVVCISNQGYTASLEPRKLYESLPDRQAQKLGQVRIVDESGEDYLYPAEFFESVELSAPVEKRLSQVA